MQSGDSGAGILFLIFVVGGLIALRMFLRRRRTPKVASGARNIGPSVAPASPQIVPLAESRTERLAAIDAFYANELNAIEIRVGDCPMIKNRSFSDAAEAVGEKITGRSRNDPGFQSGNWKADAAIGLFSAWSDGARTGSAIGALSNTVLRRTLRDMPETERALLRLTDMLQEVGQLSPEDALSIKVPIVWNKGSCMFSSPGWESAAKRNGLQEGLNLLLGGHFGDVAMSSELAQTALRAALQPDSGVAEHERHIFEAYLFAGSRWLTPAEAKIPEPSPAVLRLGAFEGSDADLLYDRRESLITIAPPGAGKSQAHVIRNLLMMRAPAVVLDVKFEAFRHTAAWRRQNVGRVFAFAPTMPGGSMRYNPLDAVSLESGRAWDDARRLADLLVVPLRSDPYFENRARDFLTAAVLDVALTEPLHHRNMNAVMDRLYLGSDERMAEWCEHLESTGSPQLARLASVIRAMPEKQREGILDSARNHMEVWQSPNLAGLIEDTDWTPADIRNGGTLYLCVALEDIKKYAGVLRVIIGQTVGGLCKGDAEAHRNTVTFFLDELPRLGRMDVIEEALDIGRGYGVRLWMFCQNAGQLRTAYPNAEGMIGNCAARCYMDPDDETAEELSRFLGNRKGLLDGTQKPLAEPTELKGPTFSDKAIVLQRGKPPAKLVRRPAFADPVCIERVREATAKESKAYA